MISLTSTQAKLEDLKSQCTGSDKTINLPYNTEQGDDGEGEQRHQLQHRPPAEADDGGNEEDEAGCEVEQVHARFPIGAP